MRTSLLRTRLRAPGRILGTWEAVHKHLPNNSTSRRCAVWFLRISDRVVALYGGQVHVLLCQILPHATDGRMTDQAREER